MQTPAQQRQRASFPCSSLSSYHQRVFANHPRPLCSSKKHHNSSTSPSRTFSLASEKSEKGSTTHGIDFDSSSSSSPSSSLSAVDLSLPAPLGGAAISVFGVMHGDVGGWEIGEYILKHRPHTVVVETALNQSHGSATGNEASLQECLMISRGGTTDAMTRAIAHLGVQLSEFADPMHSPLWQQVSRSPYFFNEHLAYAAAFAVGARLIHGDRPKVVTYQRMLWKPSIVDLDSAVGLQSALNYHDLVPKMRAPCLDPATTSTATTTAAPGVTEQIFIGERDAVLLKSMHTASIEAGEGALVVGVVGASHIDGMRELWAKERWRDVIASGAEELPDHHHGENETPEQYGVRRALLEGVFRLSCRPEVLYGFAEQVGRVPPASEEAYDLTHEVYASSRMLLASLDKDQLDEVCQGWRCDMWEVLRPMREVRPSQGGLGFDLELAVHLRTLNFDIS